MLNKRLLKRATRLAEKIETPAMTDTVEIIRNQLTVYSGPARFVFTGKTEAVTATSIGATFVYGYVEMHAPKDMPQTRIGDIVYIRESVEPALVNRRGLIEFAEPMTTHSGFQRVTIRLESPPAE